MPANVQPGARAALCPGKVRPSALAVIVDDSASTVSCIEFEWTSTVVGDRISASTRASPASTECSTEDDAWVSTSVSTLGALASVSAGVDAIEEGVVVSSGVSWE